MTERSPAAGTSAAIRPSRSKVRAPSDPEPTRRYQWRIEACSASHMSAHLGARRAQLVERALGVARLHVDPPDRLPIDGDTEALPQSVRGRLLDAVIGRQAHDRDLVDAALAQQRGQVRRLEAGVALEVGAVARV